MWRQGGHGLRFDWGTHGARHLNDPDACSQTPTVLGSGRSGAR